MVKMPVRDQDRVRLRRQMSHSFSNARDVRLNARPERDVQKVHPREIRIDKQGVALEFELIAVCAEISHAHPVARTCDRITDNQVRRRTQSRAKGLRREF